MGTTMPPTSNRTSQTRLATASVISARNVPPTRMPSAPNAAQPNSTSSSAQPNPAASGRQPSAKAIADSTTIWIATTPSTATSRPATSSQRGSAVAASRRITP